MSEVLIRPWSEEDLPLLENLLGDPAVMEHLGGPESPEQIRARHQRYLHLPETDHMFTVVLEAEPVGSIGYWELNWRGEQAHEMGWFVLPAYQGRGLATEAGKLVLEHARQERRHRFMHAFPAVSNPASNAICRKLGFLLIEACQVEYPRGRFMEANDWRLDLFGKQDGASFVRFREVQQ